MLVNELSLGLIKLLSIIRTGLLVNPTTSSTVKVSYVSIY